MVPTNYLSLIKLKKTLIFSKKQGLKSRARWGYLARDLAFGRGARGRRVYLARLVKSREISRPISRWWISRPWSYFLLKYPLFPQKKNRRRRERSSGSRAGEDRIWVDLAGSRSLPPNLARRKCKSAQISPCTPDLAR